MRTQIDIKRLRYIAEIARCESITTAAETLSLTQPALTRSVAEVEAELGTKLFHRLPRGVQLTETGERFVQRARQIIGDVDDLITDIRDASTSLSGRLRIGVAPSGYVDFIMRDLATIARLHPDVRIETITGSAQELCPRLLRGELNLLVGPSSYLKRWKELQIQELHELHFGCLLRHDHPLRGQRNLQETDVLAYPVILPSSVEPVYSDTAQRYAFHSLNPPQPCYTIDSFEAVKEFVRVSDAWFPLNAPTPTFGSLDEEFWILRDVVELPTHTVSVASATNQPASAEAQLFEALMLERYNNKDAIA